METIMTADINTIAIVLIVLVCVSCALSLISSEKGENMYIPLIGTLIVTTITALILF